MVHYANYSNYVETLKDKVTEESVSVVADQVAQTMGQNIANSQLISEVNEKRKAEGKEEVNAESKKNIEKMKTLSRSRTSLSGSKQDLRVTSQDRRGSHSNGASSRLTLNDLKQFQD